MNKLEELFGQSNYLLFSELNYPGLKDIIIARTNLARSISLTDDSNTEFDKLLKSIEYSLESSNDIMTLSIIGRVQGAVNSIADSFTSIVNIAEKAKR